MQRQLRALVLQALRNRQKLCLPNSAEQTSERSSWLSMKARAIPACKVGPTQSDHATPSKLQGFLTSTRHLELGILGWLLLC